MRRVARPLAGPARSQGRQGASRLRRHARTAYSGPRSSSTSSVRCAGPTKDGPGSRGGPRPAPGRGSRRHRQTRSPSATPSCASPTSRCRCLEISRGIAAERGPRRLEAGPRPPVPVRPRRNLHLARRCCAGHRRPPQGGLADGELRASRLCEMVELYQDPPRRPRLGNRRLPPGPLAIPPTTHAGQGSTKPGPRGT